jgi:hypothetical protein
MIDSVSGPTVLTRRTFARTDVRRIQMDSLIGTALEDVAALEEFAGDIRVPDDGTVSDVFELQIIDAIERERWCMDLPYPNSPNR